MDGIQFINFTNIRGVPVATVALDGAKNGAILAVEILGSSNSKIQEKVIAYKKILKTR